MPDEGQVGVYFDSGGCRLVGTLFLAPDDDSKPVALFLHGLPGIEKNYDLALGLRDRGWNSLIFHYRGCWGSHGRYSLRTIPDDVRAALDHLRSGLYPQVDPARVVLVGHDIGGWAAILTAAAGADVRGVAVYGAVADPRPLALDAPVAEAKVTPWLHGATPEGLAAEWQRLDTMGIPIEHVARLAPRPLLILHGSSDHTVPVEQAELLFTRATEPRELVIHPQADHAFTWHRSWLQGQLLGWLDRLGLRDEKPEA